MSSLSWSVCVVELVCLRRRAGGWVRCESASFSGSDGKCRKEKKKLTHFLSIKFIVTSRGLLPDNGRENGGGSGRKLHG